ncbi:MAG: Glycogen synthase [Bacteroidetes bacterium ADurb.Bin174]|jgi:glycosyltransferase involved in cell wall biosynthesis|nr:MAG: Glycogen synthase [Bacteroidetes bacterium ADurb.Bin174]
MKILQINNFHYRRGGSETVYFNTAELLKKNNHEVIFFSSNMAENLPCAQNQYFISNINDMSRWKGLQNYFYNREAKDKLEKLIKAEKPDIAHAHLFWGNISPSIFSVLRKHEIPLIHTAHDYRMVCPAYTFTDTRGNVCKKCQGKYFYWCALRRCSKGNLLESLIMTAEMYFRNAFFSPVKYLDGIIYVSNFAKQKHLQYNHGFSNVPAMVLYNFVAQSNRRYLAQNERKYFLYFGRLSHEKGLHCLIEAFHRMPDYPLKIVGTGPEEEELIDYVRKNKIENIEFVGFKTGVALKKFISEAAFVIVPSEWYENNPMTIIEAYSMGVPVIGANIGGIPEILPDGKTGFLFAPKDAESLKHVIARASQLNEQDYKAMSDNALQFAADNFNEELYYQRLDTFYNDIISLKNKEKG